MPGMSVDTVLGFRDKEVMKTRLRAAGLRVPRSRRVRTAAQVREAAEEIGLEAARVELLGRLPEYRTSTGFAVTPVVGWAEPPLAYIPDPHEVAEVFEVPLAFLLDVANHRYESAFYRGRMRHYWAMPYGERFIWGATAGMLVTFQRLMSRNGLPSLIPGANGTVPA